MENRPSKSDEQPSLVLTKSANFGQTYNEHEAAEPTMSRETLPLEFEFLKAHHANNKYIQKLIANRKSFVEKITAENISFLQFWEHIEEESQILNFCDAKIKEPNLEVNITENIMPAGYIITVLSNRVNTFYSFIFRLFPVDVCTVVSYINFFLKYKEHITENSNLLKEILSKKVNDPEVYIAAAKFLYEKTSDIDASRQHIAVGLKYYDNYPCLYVCDFWFETQLLHDNDGMSLPNALNKYRNIKQRFRGKLSIHTELLDCAKRFSTCGELLFHIINDMIVLYDTNELIWAKLADVCLDGFFFDQDEKTVIYDQHCIRTNRLKKCMNAFEDGLKRVPQERLIKLWDLYIETMIKLWKEHGMKNESLRNFLNEEMDKVFVRAQANDMICKPHHYLYWALHSKKGSSSILAKAISMNNNNPTIWLDLLNIYAENDHHNMVKKVFNNGLLALRNQYLVWPFWESMCSYINKKDPESVIKFYQHGINSTCPEISMKLQHKYLLWTNDIKGLPAARKLFTEMNNAKPTSLELYKCMIYIELPTKNLDKAFISGLYTESCMKFGRGNLNLWIESIRFMYLSDMHTEAEEILKSSYSFLETESVKKLENEFGFIKDEYKRLHDLFTTNLNVLNVNDDNESPLEKNNCPSKSTDN